MRCYQAQTAALAAGSAALILLALMLLASAACNSPEGPAGRVPTTDPAPTTTSEPTPTQPPTINPGPAAYPPWQPDHLVARTAEASVAVHKVVISEDLITLIYSVELAHADFSRTVLVSPEARLIGTRPEEVLAPIAGRILRYGYDVSLGALSFQGISTDSAFYSLVIPELNASRVSDGREMTVPGPWTIPVIKEHEKIHDAIQSWFPRQHWDGRLHSDRRGVRSRNPGKGYEGDSSIGWIVTGGFYFLGRPLYLMVGPGGNVIEIPEGWYWNTGRLLAELRTPPPTAGVVLDDSGTGIDLGLMGPQEAVPRATELAQHLGIRRFGALIGEPSTALGLLTTYGEAWGYYSDDLMSSYDKIDPGEGTPVWVMIFEGEIFAECEQPGCSHLVGPSPWIPEKLEEDDWKQVLVVMDAGTGELLLRHSYHVGQLRSTEGLEDLGRYLP